MEIKNKAKERMEMRIHAEATLRAVISWIQAVKPSEWLPSMGKEQLITQEEVNAQWRDFIDKGGGLITKLWKPAELLVDDLTAFMEEMCAKPKGPPEDK